MGWHIKVVWHHRWISRTKGQQSGKCFYLMTSSCNAESVFMPWRFLTSNIPYFWWEREQYKTRRGRSNIDTIASKRVTGEFAARRASNADKMFPFDAVIMRLKPKYDSSGKKYIYIYLYNYHITIVLRLLRPKAYVDSLCRVAFRCGHRPNELILHFQDNFTNTGTNIWLVDRRIYENCLN